jgi:uncharacterized protein YbjT (DUF2867 family)
MGRVVVLGGSGEMGRRVVDRLIARGHEVRPASRATGIDARSGAGLDDALTGADTVVDCLNLQTASRRRAVDFFGGSATAVTAVAGRAGVGHLVCLSIVNVTDPAVRRATGYYAGKAAQEEAYLAGSTPLTVVRTTAWFTLAETFLTQVRVGSVAVVPHLLLRPVHPDAAAEALVAAVEEDAPPGGRPARRELAGPEVHDAVDLARRVAAARHPGVRVVGLPVPVRRLREGLLPSETVPTDDRRFAAWLEPSD